MIVASLEEFLAPMSQARFLHEIYGVKPAYMPGERGRFIGLLSWDRINEILSQHRMAAPRMKLAKEGAVVDASQYLRTVSAGGSQLNLSNLNSQFRTGAMLVINSIEETHVPITELCRMLERALGEYVYVNAYAGWYSTQGFNTHWDDHDVIITQVCGRKHWRVFEPERRYPIERYEPAKSKPPAADPLWEGDLHSGDLLYIPRGWWHDAVPVGEPTLHLTVTIRRRTGLSLMDKVLERLHECEEIRADLPRFASAEEQERYMEKFRTTISGILQELTLEKYFRDFDATAPPRVRPSFPWSAMPESLKLVPQVWLHWLPPRKVPIEEIDGRVVLTAMGSTFGFQSVAAPVLRRIAGKLRIQLHDLCAEFPHIDPEAMEKFVLELISKGLLAISPDEYI